MEFPLELEMDFCDPKSSTSLTLHLVCNLVVVIGISLASGSRDKLKLNRD